MTDNDKQYLENTAKILVGCSAETIRTSLEVAYKMGRFDVMYENVQANIEERTRETNRAIADLKRRLAV